MRQPRVGVLALLPLLLEPVPAVGQVGLVEAESWSLELGGYTRALTAVHDLGFEPPGGEARTAFHGQVARLRWTARGDGWVLEVHDRLQARVTSAPAGGVGSVVGFGVSAVPDRSVDLETTLIEEERFRVWHDLDRLALTLYADVADITLGRQAITWGISNLFPVADLWSRFSPFELDTEEKPGIDAARVLAYPADGLELDVVVADRGSLDDLSAGLRATWSLPDADLYLGAGKFWREAIVLAGGTWLLDEVRLRAETALPFELDGGGASRPRVTAGADWLRGAWVSGLEIHYNGIGATEPDAYTTVLGDARLRRGETYFLGRWLAGAWVSHTPSDRVTLALSALVNPGDPSVALTPSAGWDLGQSARLSLGGLVSFGDSPAVPAEGPPRLRSEFGAYGTLGYTQLAIYF